MSKPLHRRLFLWFGVSILLTGLIVGTVMGLSGPGRQSWRNTVDNVRSFVSGRYARIWDRPTERAALTRALADEFRLAVAVLDPNGATLHHVGDVDCRRPYATDVVRNGARIGAIKVCVLGRGPRPWALAFALLVAGATLWIASGWIARRLTRPLGELVSVANDLGEGDLTRRAALRCAAVDEVGVLGEAINQMAGRIEKQLADQRELLAAVSHEIRTPLGHISVLTEIARDGGVASDTVTQIEREVFEIDALVGDLLARSRLEFAAESRQRLDASDLSVRALQRAGLSHDLLVCDTDDASVDGDPTLLLRALANLVDNGIKHGGAVAQLRIARDGDGDTITLAVDDAGPGFSEEARERAFDPFFEGERPGRTHASLGLGLALVRRIAQAHGGDAWAENLDGGGARVGLRLPRRAG